jgi:hypothetical protein
MKAEQIARIIAIRMRCLDACASAVQAAEAGFLLAHLSVFLKTASVC